MSEVARRRSVGAGSRAIEAWSCAGAAKCEPAPTDIAPPEPPWERCVPRYEPTPPPDMPRPDYIPDDQRHQAGYVEIEYPEHGVARVWRVPR